jgi:hypothetical protein
MAVVPLQRSQGLTIAMQIGSIVLTGFEVPSTIRFGGSQRLAIHRMSSGARLVERLGPDDNDITFEGVFSGPNAEARAREMDSLRISGDTIWLTWQSFRRLVVVKNLLLSYDNSMWLPFRLTLTVARQQMAMAIDGVTKPTTASQLLSAVSAPSAALNLDLPALSAAVTNTDAQTPGSAANALALGNITVVLQSVQAMMTAAEQPVAGASAEDFASSTYALTFSALLTNAAILSNGAAVRAYLGRIAVSLSSPGD